MVHTKIEDGLKKINRARTTLTTAGYDNICPVTPAGKVLVSPVAIIDIGLFALPAGIIAAGFELLSPRRSRTVPIAVSHGENFPWCGENLSNLPQITLHLIEYS